MNKVFINERPLYLICSAEELKSEVDRYTSFSNSDELAKSVKLFEQNESLKSMAVQFSSEKEKQQALYSIFKVIEAAGGIVTNKKGEILFIFRQGKWDLPKGKIEKNEKEKEAAIREVEEECGIKNLSLQEKFTETYHTYHLKGKNILKISHWYKMHYTGKSEQLVPQVEEGITAACWMSEKEIKAAMKNTFASIHEVMKLYGEKRNQ